jgi:copper chaperone CopZ
MKRRTIINLVLVVAAVTLVGLCALAVRVRPVADSVAVLSTAGMTCGGCGSRIAGTLQAQQGVAAVEVDVKGGWVTVGYDAKSIAPAAISTAVAGLGYRNRVTQLLSVDQFRRMTGRYPGAAAGQSGCCGNCGLRK